MDFIDDICGRPKLSLCAPRRGRVPLPNNQALPSPRDGNKSTFSTVPRVVRFHIDLERLVRYCREYPEETAARGPWPSSNHHILRGQRDAAPPWPSPQRIVIMTPLQLSLACLSHACREMTIARDKPPGQIGLRKTARPFADPNGILADKTLGKRTLHPQKTHESTLPSHPLSSWHARARST